MSSDSSDNSFTGHHETWDDFAKTQAKEICQLQEEVKRLQWKNDHLEWHCCVYQHTLGKLSGGVAEHQRSLAEYRRREQPVCPCCEREELIKRIAFLEQKLSQRDGDGSSTQPS